MATWRSHLFRNVFELCGNRIFVSLSDYPRPSKRIDMVEAINSVHVPTNMHVAVRSFGNLEFSFVS